MKKLVISCVVSSFFACHSWAMENEDNNSWEKNTSHVHQKIKKTYTSSSATKKPSILSQKNTIEYDKENSKCSKIATYSRYIAAFGIACFIIYEAYDIYDMALKIRGASAFI